MNYAILSEKLKEAKTLIETNALWSAKAGRKSVEACDDVTCKGTDMATTDKASQVIAMSMFSNMYNSLTNSAKTHMADFDECHNHAEVMAVWDDAICKADLEASREILSENYKHFVVSLSI